MIGRRLLLWVLVFLCVCSSPALAQRAPAGGSSTQKHATATRIATGRIVLDGKLDEAFWKRAKPATDFVQQEPRNGEAATEKTEVYVLYKDIRTYGFKEDYYREAATKGVLFINYEDERKPQVVNGNGQLKVTVWEPVIKEEIEIDPDIVVLSA